MLNEFNKEVQTWVFLMKAGFARLAWHCVALDKTSIEND
jgi:hypothetical protein